MNKNPSSKPIYDLEERTFQFAKSVRHVLRKMKRDYLQEDDIRQLIRASGSVGANYIEANEALSKKDFVHRIKICRKEAKECTFWIRLLSETSMDDDIDKLKKLLEEAIELKKIFSSICNKSE
jgi:four helix bundle protein